MNIGENIKRLRKERGMTQEDLANSRALKTSPQNISYWENGRDPGIEMLDRIANALDITVNELLSLPGTVTTEREKDLSQVPTKELMKELERRLK